MSVFTYLDDWLIVGQSWASMEAALALTWRLVAELGFPINTEKSQPTPSQCLTFLGASLDFRGST